MSDEIFLKLYTDTIVMGVLHYQVIRGRIELSFSVYCAWLQLTITLYSSNMYTHMHARVHTYVCTYAHKQIHAHTIRIHQGIFKCLCYLHYYHICTYPTTNHAPVYKCEF